MRRLEIGAPWDKVHRRSWQQTATCTERLQLDEIGDAASCAEPQQPETSLYAHPYARSFRGTADLTSGVTVLFRGRLGWPEVVAVEESSATRAGVLVCVGLDSSA